MKQKQQITGYIIQSSSRISGCSLFDLLKHKYINMKTLDCLNSLWLIFSTFYKNRWAALFIIVLRQSSVWGGVFSFSVCHSVTVITLIYVLSHTLHIFSMKKLSHEFYLTIRYFVVKCFCLLALIIVVFFQLILFLLSHISFVIYPLVCYPLHRFD